ncbi:hypothetical protein [Roseococcus pinisoli]|uniref:MarR family transcriptional regulator n=1 Tax=Roseococcus pinisoli TaxID=2835040 RepID=A0ABS5QCC7_9PROT|nr:hypothetical protein [Roseococcus pinisoli]MBS7811172.1 hypothetical protein [Roseococcus pinisoli]
MTPDPATIARGLSPAQAKALADPMFRDLAWCATAGIAGQLSERGLVRRPYPSNRRYWYLTPLGLAVRAELDRMEAGDE